jgi:hypothetical protein
MMSGKVEDGGNGGNDIVIPLSPSPSPKLLVQPTDNIGLPTD